LDIKIAGITLHATGKQAAPLKKEGDRRLGLLFYVGEHER
jgi:hypothetical protein